MHTTETASRTAPAPNTSPLHTGIATVCLSGSLDDKLAAISVAGFDGVEIFENDLIASPDSPESIRARCAELGLSIDLYQPFRDFEGAPPARRRSNLRRAARKFELMRRLGAELLLVCSSVAPDTIDDDDLAAAQLHELAALAAEHGIRIAYEALAWGKHVHTYEHSWRIVERVDHPSLGLCLDSFHILSKGSDPTGIREIPADKLFFVQLADAPRMNMDVLQWSRHHRLFPGQGSFDLTGFVGHALAAGYGGPLSLEVFNDVFRQADPGPAAVDALRSVRTLREQLPDGHAIPDETPAAPDLAGYAFIELAADATAGPTIARELSALGFVHAGTHRSKPVQLWQQGQARVLLNYAASGRHTSGIAALGVESTDPERSARRAHALLTVPAPRTRGEDEAELTAVTAPDGTQVFLCRGDSDPASWLSDFAPVATETQGRLTGIDHVALTQPFDHFDEAALFYRSVLGLEPESTTEFAAPFGLVRSRAVTDENHRVRLTLDGTLLRRGDWAPAVSDPQHVAFGADDIFATARAARTAGASILPIPDNYYDDLDARLELDPDMLAAMRDLSVLYDHDADGEFLHFYTDMLDARVYFEVVQRIDNYTGYGAANAAVHMAAHRTQRLARQR